MLTCCLYVTNVKECSGGGLSSVHGFLLFRAGGVGSPNIWCATNPETINDFEGQFSVLLKILVDIGDIVGEYLVDLS